MEIVLIYVSGLPFLARKTLITTLLTNLIMSKSGRYRCINCLINFVIERYDEIIN